MTGDDHPTWLDADDSARTHVSAPGLITVHIRVNDASGGQPVPARLRVAGPNGAYFAPLGRAAEFPIGRNEDVGGSVLLDGRRHAYIDGACEIRLPTGVPLDVEIARGPDWHPLRERVTLGPGQMALRFALRQWRHDPSRVAADARCHFLDPHAAALEAAAEGLDLVNLLATEQDFPSQDGKLYRTTPHIMAFSGQKPALTANGAAVVVNTFNVHPALGRLGLLDCHRPVFPLAFGGMDDSDDWSLCDWADQCHRKGGVVVWCDAYRPEAGLAGGEALVAAILGKIDALEIDSRPRQRPLLTFWYRLLNAGIHLPIVGGSGKDSNRTPLGAMRTITRIEAADAPLAAWAAQTRSGRTCATNGPCLSLAGPGVVEGGRLTVQPNEGPLRISAAAESLAAYDRLELVHNGEVIAEAAPDGETYAARIECACLFDRGGWIAARCSGSARSELDRTSPIFAHTSPIQVEVGGRAAPGAIAAIRSLRAELEEVRRWVETMGRFHLPRRKENLLARCDEALAVLDRQASQAEN